MKKGFNVINEAGYRRIDKKKAKRLFNEGFEIHLVPYNAGMNTHHTVISKERIPDFDKYAKAYKECYCVGRDGYPTYYINVADVMGEEVAGC